LDADGTRIQREQKSSSPRALIIPENRERSHAFPGAHLMLELWRHADFPRLIRTMPNWITSELPTIPRNVVFGTRKVLSTIPLTAYFT